MPDRGAFVAFLDGYVALGGTLFKLEEQDFAKWIAALVDWFCFQARRALGDWDDENQSERKDAIAKAHNALTSLRSTLEQLSTWVKWC